MFDIGFSEVIVVAIVSVLCFKPEDWPRIKADLRGVISKLRQVRQSIDDTVNQITDDTDQSVNYNFTEFQKEFLEPIDDKKKKQ